MIGLLLAGCVAHGGLLDLGSTGADCTALCEHYGRPRCSDDLGNPLPAGAGQPVLDAALGWIDRCGATWFDCACADPAWLEDQRAGAIATGLDPGSPL